MTGARWREVALVLLFGNAARSWLTVDGQDAALVTAVLWTVAAIVFLTFRVRERPRCRFQLPVMGPLLKPTDHKHHHCADELGHASDTHKCRCGLGYTLLGATK